MLRLSAEAVDVAVRLHGLAQPVGGDLGLSRAPEAQQVGFLLNTLQAGSGECPSVWHKEEEKEARTKRENICRVGQSHNPVVILGDKLGFSVWLGKPPVQLVILTAAEPSLWELRFFISFLGEGQKENLISSVFGPWMG